MTDIEGDNGVGEEDCMPETLNESDTDDTSQYNYSNVDNDDKKPEKDVGLHGNTIYLNSRAISFFLEHGKLLKI